MNTVYRKKDKKVSQSAPDQKGKRRNNQDRIPFSFDGVRNSTALASVSHPFDGASNNSSPIEAELGSYPITSLELCEMGSYDGKGGYRSVGGISLIPATLSSAGRSSLH